MLKYVKEGALDLLALWPSSLLESIRQVSEDDFLSPHLSHKQRQPRLRRRNSPTTGLFASKAIAPRQRHHPAHEHSTLDRDLVRSRQLDLPDCPSKPSIQLPYEILVLIFRHLPASDLFSMLAVNRQWRQIALLETKQIDLSECFPVDCLGLENEEYSDFDFVYNLFSIFPLISSLVIKDRYLRDRDLRVVTAGILAGKMAFTPAGGPPVGSEEYESARRAVAEQRLRRTQLEQQEGRQAADSTAEGASIAPPTRSTIKEMPDDIQVEVRKFSRSVGTYVLIPQTRNTLRKKILERLEQNLELKEIQEYHWMLENGIDPDAGLSSPVTAAVFASCLSSSFPGASSQDGQKRYPLVPMAHYRFQDCCFANDWGAIMDVNKLPMIGLAAAISRQGLVVDLEGSYGAPSKSIRTMLGFCFGAQCVLSLEFNFRHTHMELEHVTELLSENAILYKVDIVDSPAYRKLIRLPAFRGLGSFLRRMHDACLDVDERVLEETLEGARVLLQEIERDFMREEQVRDEWKAGLKVGTDGSSDKNSPTASNPYYVSRQPPMNDHSRPIESLSQQLTFPGGISLKDRFRTTKVLLKGVLDHGMVGLINTRARRSGQSLLHALAWKRSYASLVALAMNLASNNPIGLSATPPPPPHSTRPYQDETSSVLSSSYPPRGGFWSTSQGYFSSSPPPAASSSAAAGTVVDEMASTHVYEQEAVGSGATTEELISSPVQESQLTATSALSSLMSISSLPAALNSALSFRRMSLPVSTLWIPGDSEDIGVGEGTLPTLENDDEADVEDVMASTQESGESVDGVEERADEDKGSPVILPPVLAWGSAAAVVVPEQHPAAIALRMAKTLLELKANPNVYNKDGRSAVVCASYMGFQPMESLLVEHGGYSKELIRIRETM